MITVTPIVDQDRDLEVSLVLLLTPYCFWVIIQSQVTFLRKSYGSRLNVFAPVNDLSMLSKSGSQERSLIRNQKNDVAISGGQVLGDEYSDYVVKVLFPLSPWFQMLMMRKES